MQRPILVLCLFASLALAPPARALERAAYSESGFDAALASGRPVLLHVQRLRDPACRDQWQAAERLRESALTENAVIMLIDTGTQRAALRRFGITRDCTLIAFRDGRETSRRIGTVDPIGIRAMFGGPRSPQN
jgi:hypothetical protein